MQLKPAYRKLIREQIEAGLYRSASDLVEEPTDRSPWAFCFSSDASSVSLHAASR